MAASFNEIKKWFMEATSRNLEVGDNASKYTHMIIVCDTYDHDDYPVYVTDTQDCLEVINREKSKPMSKVMEVYNLKFDMMTQLDTDRCWNI